MQSCRIVMHVAISCATQIVGQARASKLKVGALFQLSHMQQNVTVTRQSEVTVTFATLISILVMTK